MLRTVQIQLQLAAFVGDDVASSVNAAVVAAVVAKLINSMDGVALLVVAGAGCIARCIFHTLCL